MSFKRLTFVVVLFFIYGCAAQNATVSKSKSPIDDKTRVTIDAPPFSTSYIYPADGQGTGISIEGGSVIDKKKATITFKSSVGGLLNATFKADDLLIETTPVGQTNDYDVNKYGTKATRSFAISCDQLQKVAKAQQAYLRIDYANGFVDYSITNTNTPGADGVEMVRKIASYCE